MTAPWANMCANSQRASPSPPVVWADDVTDVASASIRLSIAEASPACCDQKPLVPLPGVRGEGAWASRVRAAPRPCREASTTHSAKGERAGVLPEERIASERKMVRV